MNESELLFEGSRWHLLLTLLLSASLCGYVAAEKNRSFWKWFFLGALGPQLVPIAMLALMALPALSDEQKEKRRNQADARWSAFRRARTQHRKKDQENLRNWEDGRSPSSMLTLAAILALSPSVGIHAADPITGKVVSVTDGDTVRVLDAANVQHKVRLDGIDAPERGQPFGTVARDRLASLVMGKAVTVHNDGRDKWGRTLGRIEVEGQDVNRQMVADGCG